MSSCQVDRWNHVLSLVSHMMQNIYSTYTQLRTINKWNHSEMITLGQLKPCQKKKKKGNWGGWFSVNVFMILTQAEQAALDSNSILAVELLFSFCLTFPMLWNDGVGKCISGGLKCTVHKRLVSNQIPCRSSIENLEEKKTKTLILYFIGMIIKAYNDNPQSLSDHHILERDHSMICPFKPVGHYCIKSTRLCSCA